MYHETKSLQQCLKHSLNNLLQEEVFTIQSLNSIADSLGGAHRTPFLGNYDVNVLEAALAKQGKVRLTPTHMTWVCSARAVYTFTCISTA
eukprot:jgi/Chrzof1/4397/Cz14g11180.t1